MRGRTQRATRVGKLIVASADAHRPPDRHNPPLDDEHLPTAADYQAMRDAYDAVAPDPTHFDAFAAKTSTMVVQEFAGWPTNCGHCTCRPC